MTAKRSASTGRRLFFLNNQKIENPTSLADFESVVKKAMSQK